MKWWATFSSHFEHVDLQFEYNFITAIFKPLKKQQFLNIREVFVYIWIELYSAKIITIILQCEIPLSYIIIITCIKLNVTTHHIEMIMRWNYRTGLLSFAELKTLMRFINLISPITHPYVNCWKALFTQLAMR